MLKDKFRDLDLFGQTVTLSSRGQFSYKTIFGAVITFIVTAIVLAQGLYLFVGIIFKENSTFVETVNQRPDFSEKFHHPFENDDFLIAFGLHNTELDPRFGKLTLKHYNVREILDDSNNTIWDKQVNSVDLADCSDESIQKKWRDQLEVDLDQEFHIEENRQKFERVISRKLSELRHLKCPDLEAISKSKEDFRIQGQEFQESYQYFQFEIEPCSGSTCEQNRTTIADYFSFKPVKLTWFDTHFLKKILDSDSQKTDGENILPSHLTRNYNQYSTEITPFTQKQVKFGIQVNEAQSTGSNPTEAHQIDYLEMKLNQKDFVIRMPEDQYVKFQIMLDQEVFQFMLFQFDFCRRFRLEQTVPEVFPQSLLQQSTGQQRQHDESMRMQGEGRVRNDGCLQAIGGGARTSGI